MSGTALVTGASNGIGRAVAEDLLGRGWRVVCTARGRERLEAAFAGRDGALIWPLDVTDAEAVAALPDALPEDWRGIELLVANAGSDVGGRKPFADGDMADWASTIETNVTGVMRICHALLPGMLTRARCDVVIVGSISGLSAYAGGSAYSPSKYAVRAFAESLRRDYPAAPLRVIEVRPGIVETGFAEARSGSADAAEDFYGSFPAKLQAADIAASVMFAIEQPARVNISEITVVPTGDKPFGK